MKYTHKVTIEWKNKNPIQQTMLMTQMNKFFEKIRKKEDLIYSMMTEQDKFVIHVLCNERLALQQKSTWMARKMGVNVVVEKIK